VNVFELVKQILDQTYAKIEGSNDEKCERISKALKDMASRYSALKREGDPPDYRDPVVRFAYLYAYVTSHTCMVYESILDSDELRNLFKQERVSVSCLGGGPGSDFLGILKYLAYSGDRPKLRFNIFDRERAWQNTWANVDEKVEMELNLGTNYSQFDVTEPGTWEAYDHFLGSDLFIMLYFMSELWGVKDAAHEFFEYVFTKSESGSLFLYIDNMDSDFAGWFEELVNGCGLELVYSGDLEVWPPHEEQKDVLGEYLTMFKRFPKLKSRIAVRLARKK